MCPRAKSFHWQKRNKPEEQKRPFSLSNFMRITDYLFVPGLIFWFAYEPNFRNGLLDYLEAGQYLSVINEVFSGKIPVKDVFTNFGPLHIYLPALAMQAFGKSLGVLRGYFHFGTIISLVTAYLLGKAVCRRRFFSYLLAFLLVIEVNHPFWSTRWGGIRMGLGLAVLLFFVIFARNGKNIYLVLSGVFSGISLFYSPEFGIINFISVIVALMLFFFAATGSSKVKNYAIYLIGASLAVIPVLSYFLLKGGLGVYLRTTFIIFPQSHGKVWLQPLPRFIPDGLNALNLFNWLFSLNFKMLMPGCVYAGAFIYVVYKLARRNVTPRVVVIFTLAFYGLLTYIGSFRAILGPQFLVAMPTALILICLFMEACFNLIGDNFRRHHAQSGSLKADPLTIALAIVSLAFSLVYVLFSEKRYYGSLSGWVFCQENKKDLSPVYTMPVPALKLGLEPLGIMRAKGILVPAQQKEEIEAVTEYLIRNTQPQEPVFTFPELGIFNFFSDRPCVGRFPISGVAWMNAEFKKELFDDLKRTKPRYVVLERRLSNLAMSIGRKEEVFPEVLDYIKENYVSAEIFNSIEVCRLK